MKDIAFVIWFVLCVVCLSLGLDEHKRRKKRDEIFTKVMKQHKGKE
jgi:hypothetical protein